MSITKDKGVEQQSVLTDNALEIEGSILTIGNKN